MMSNKNKGILIFAILYTVLFVFDGAKLLSYLMPSAIANYLQYLVYVVLALYGSFYSSWTFSLNFYRQY